MANICNIQGDVLIGLPKKTETFLFFRIADAKKFQIQLKNFIPLITTCEKATSDRRQISDYKKKKAGLLHVTGVNIAFSAKGLATLNIKPQNGESFDDHLFNAGMRAGAVARLGDQEQASDKTQPKWDPEFLQEIHGVILVTGDCHDAVRQRLNDIALVFSVQGKSSILELFKIRGDVRTDVKEEKRAGHEHFGYADGISQPAVIGVDTSPPPSGTDPIEPGNIVLGQKGDNVVTFRGEDASGRTTEAIKRPEWAKDGSYLVFRKLKQKVPEFNKFLVENAVDGDKDLLGARFVGRWKSGAPIVLSPEHDNPSLGEGHPQENNNFSFTDQSQAKCPWAAHIRKTNPRNFFKGDLKPFLNQSRIIRRGIPFGPEVSPEEKSSGKSLNDREHERGLLFVCYQSSIELGFQLVQNTWANNTGFPFGKTNPPLPPPGFDPIIGQNKNDDVRKMIGALDDRLEVLDLGKPQSPEEWVESKGGEYFFSPSIAALKNTFSSAA